MKVKVMCDILAGQASVEVLCCIKKTVVRKITAAGDNVRIEAGDDSVQVPASTPLAYFPWVMDRGNIAFDAPDVYGPLKLCTEKDIVRLPNGHQEEILMDDPRALS